MPMANHTPEIKEQKLRVVRLIDAWIKRTGLKRQSLAAQAGFLDYNQFYKAYLDTSRRVERDPSLAIGVVRAVTDGLPRARKATVTEALQFLEATAFPYSRLDEVAALFDQDEWAAAQGATGMTGASAAARAQKSDAPADRLSANTDEPEAELLAATARLATMVDELPEPAALPLPYRMPLPRGSFFSGRNEELQILARLVATQELGGIVALTGIGGVGKTSLASEFVHRYGQFFAGGVFWLNCADPQNVLLEVVACGEAGLVAHERWRDLNAAERAQLVTQSWQAPTPRLLVFDNCEEDATLRRWRPTSGGCRVLLTSRRASWSASLGVTAVSLQELSPAVSLALLQRYRPDLSHDDPGLAALAAELGGLPLALHLAGSYLETYSDDLVLGDPARLAQNLQAIGPLNHDALRGIDVASTITDHELDLSRSFGLSLARLDQTSPRGALARAFLACTTWLAPGEPFGVAVLAAALNAAEVEARAAVQQLVNFGLLRNDSGTLRVHRLIASFAHATIAMPEAESAVRRAIVTLTEQAYRARDGVMARELLPHALCLDRDVAEDASLIQLWNALPFLLEFTGDVAGGLPYLERAFVALQASEQVESELGGELLNNLAEWHRFLGRVEQGHSFHLQALAVRQRVCGPEAMAVAESHCNLGDTLRELSNYEGAQYHLEQALAISLRHGGPRHEYTLVTRNQLALILYSQGRFAEARDELREVVEASEQTYGLTDPRTSLASNNLAAALFNLGQLAEALQLISRGAEHLRASYGDFYPETLKARLNLARAHTRLEQFSEAATELRAIMQPLVETFGETHSATQLARETLAEVVARLGDETTDLVDREAA